MIIQNFPMLLYFVFTDSKTLSKQKENHETENYRDSLLNNSREVDKEKPENKQCNSILQKEITIIQCLKKYKISVSLYLRYITHTQYLAIIFVDTEEHTGCFRRQVFVLFNCSIQCLNNIH